MEFDDVYFMREAIREAVKAFEEDEVPVGAVVVANNKIIARGMVDEELEFPSKIVNEFVNSDNEIDTIKTKIYYLMFDSDTVIVDDIEGRKQGNLITLTTEQSLKYNIADASIDNFDAVLDSLGFSTLSVKKTKENWSESFVRFLTNPVVASLLTTFGFLGILFELQSPGWGIPGSIGLICLILSLSASYIAELATMNDLLVIFLGILFLFVEAFVLPGFGIAGVAGNGQRALCELIAGQIKPQSGNLAYKGVLVNSFNVKHELHIDLSNDAIYIPFLIIYIIRYFDYFI